jgi:hypothetical protein
MDIVKLDAVQLYKCQRSNKDEGELLAENPITLEQMKGEIKTKSFLQLLSPAVIRLM